MKKVTCPVCRELVEVDLPKVEKFSEFVVIHRDHGFKIYVDEEGFVRRSWPIQLLYARDVGRAGHKGGYVVAFGGGRAVVMLDTGEKIAEFEAEEFGAALLKAEHIISQ
ncbi:MAG: hypothetical protein ABWK05_00385 [Pyrobaculum sp.]